MLCCDKFTSFPSLNSQFKNKSVIPTVSPGSCFRHDSVGVLCVCLYYAVCVSVDCMNLYNGLDVLSVIMLPNVLPNQ